MSEVNFDHSNILPLFRYLRDGVSESSLSVIDNKDVDALDPGSNFHAFYCIAGPIVPTLESPCETIALALIIDVREKANFSI